MSEEVRRSSRARKKSNSFYDEQAKKLQEDEGDERRNASDDDSDSDNREKEDGSSTHADSEKEEEEDPMDASSSSDEDAYDNDNDNDEDYSTSTKKKKQQQAAKAKAKRTPQITLALSPKKAPRRKVVATKTTATRGGRKQIQQALLSMSKKMLARAATNSAAGSVPGGSSSKKNSTNASTIDTRNETPSNSLFAALLHAAEPIPNFPQLSSKMQRSVLVYPTTFYTPQLESVALHCVQQLKNDANRAHVSLLNLLFRSVGGSLETTMDPNTVDLEDMDDAEKDELVTQVVHIMRTNPDDVTFLLSAQPNISQSTKLATLATQEYRKIYLEFWYRLGRLILLGTASVTPAVSDDDDDTSHPTIFSSNRMDVELVRDLVSRLTELVPVGQPDLRAGTTLAVMQLGLACTERSVEYEQKLSIAQRQFAAARGKSTAKAKGLKEQMDSWKRVQLELQELVEGSVLQAVFIHRYRDSNMYIRAHCLTVLKEIILLRPDLYCRDKYLKYLAWMCSDKESTVRLAALQGLLAPFEAYEQSQQSRARTKVPSLMMNLERLQNVFHKFLPRLVQCTNDVDEEVQEVAMKILLKLLQHEFLDDWEDDDGWNKANLKAIDGDATELVRKNALYFILDQLDAFDDGEDAESKAVVTLSEKKQVERIEGIAQWLAHHLCNGEIPIDKIRVDRVDYLVHSLHDMPEHASLVTNWSALLRAIRSSENSQQGRRPGREDVAKQRVLLRMLATAAQQECGPPLAGVGKKGATGRKRKNDRKQSASNSLPPQEALSLALLKSLPQLLLSFKGDVVALRNLTELPRYILPDVFSLPARKTEFLSLVKNLCALVVDSTDEDVLDNLAHALSILSRGSHARVPDVKVQVQKLSTVLQDRLETLLAEERDDDEEDEEDNGENDDDETTGSKSTNSKKRRRRQQASAASSRKRSRRSNRLSDGASLSTGDSNAFTNATSPLVDSENSVQLCLLRLYVVTKNCPAILLFKANNDNSGEVIELFSRTVSDAIAKRLEDRKAQPSDDASSTRYSTKSGLISTATSAFGVENSIWQSEEHAQVHTVAAHSIGYGLRLLLNLVGWTFRDAFPDYGNDEMERTNKGGDADEEEDYDPDECPILRQRNQLVKLLCECFESFAADTEDAEHTEEHVAFAATVQAYAGCVSSDVRSLFLKEWSKNAVSKRLQALALSEDAQLIGGYARYLHSHEDELREFAKQKEITEHEEDTAFSLLAPLARGLAANWTEASRKEAGIVLSHIRGSGNAAHHVTQALARLLKKIHPVRFLEAQMASLRLAFETWVSNEPDEPENDESSEEVKEFEAKLLEHAASFRGIEQQASKLSSSLGVGKLTAKLSKALLGFFREGIRFSFEGYEGKEDDLVLGSRLPFLLIVCKYASWLKKNKEGHSEIKQFLVEKEKVMSENPEFEQVHPEDLKALASFRSALGLKDKGISANIEQSSPLSVSQEDDSISVGSGSRLDVPPMTPNTTASGKRRTSVLSSQRSRHSAMSARSSLSPVAESIIESDEDGTVESEKSDIKSKGSRRGPSGGSSKMRSASQKSKLKNVDEEDEKVDEVGHDDSGEDGEDVEMDSVATP